MRVCMIRTWSMALLLLRSADATIPRHILTHFAKSHYRIEGDRRVWDTVFSARAPTQEVHIDAELESGEANILHWTEGPVYSSANRTLLFSDTIGARMYEFDLRRKRLQILRKNSGDALAADANWRAEPGSNGLAFLSEEKVLVCQHGSRRLSMYDTSDAKMSPVATKWKGKKFNGPNDLTVRIEGDGRKFVYFTDPVYAWLEKDRFEDLPYLDVAVAQKGPGRSAVYKVEATACSTLSSAEGDEAGEDCDRKDVQRIAVMDRPNGIAFLGDDLIVSDCCQGTHKASCLGGLSRWKVLEKGNEIDDGVDGWRIKKTIENNLLGAIGCADGLTVDPLTGLLISSCAGGICVVDVEAGKVMARLRTTGHGWRVSNVVIAEPEGRLFMTGDNGIWSLRLKVNRRGRGMMRGGRDVRDL